MEALLHVVATCVSCGRVSVILICHLFTCVCVCVGVREICILLLLLCVCVFFCVCGVVVVR